MIIRYNKKYLSCTQNHLHLVDPFLVGGMHNNRSRPSWSVPRARIEGEELGTFNNLVGSSNAAIGRPANHEDSLSDALEGPAADEWSFREPNHSNGVITYG